MAAELPPVDSTIEFTMEMPAGIMGAATTMSQYSASDGSYAMRRTTVSLLAAAIIDEYSPEGLMV